MKHLLKPSPKENLLPFIGVILALRKRNTQNFQGLLSTGSEFMLITRYLKVYHVTNRMEANGVLVIYGVLGHFQVTVGPIGL